MEHVWLVSALPSQDEDAALLRGFAARHVPDCPNGQAASALGQGLSSRCRVAWIGTAGGASPAHQAFHSHGRYVQSIIGWPVCMLGTNETCRATAPCSV